MPSLQNQTAKESTDWFEKHVRFVEDFDQEGSAIKEGINQDRKQSVDSQREEASLIQAANVQLKDTSNVKQMLGQRFNFSKRVKGRYDYKN